MTSMTGAIAITRAVSAGLAGCELTHLARVPIDVEVARAQHRIYEQTLAAAGYRIEHLDADAAMPDSVFVEDMAIVFDEVAILTNPGAESRRREMPAIAAALARYRPLQSIKPPATVDGGDVLIAGRKVLIGRSTRTNDAAVDQLRAILAPLGYLLSAVDVGGCLHLKSAVTTLADDMLLVNRDWIDPAMLVGYRLIDVAPDEPSAANVLRLADRVIAAQAFPRTAERIAALGRQVDCVDASELAKAEGAVTCCSLIVPVGQASR